MIKKLIVLLSLPLLFSTSSCAWWAENKGDVKSVVNTVDDIAQALCGVFYGEKMNLSVQDAVKTFCDTRDKFAPWIDAVLAGAKAGGDVKLGIIKPVALEDPWAKPAPALTPPVQSATSATPTPAPAVAPSVQAPTPLPAAEPPAKGKPGVKGTAK